MAGRTQVGLEGVQGEVTKCPPTPCPCCILPQVVGAIFSAATLALYCLVVAFTARHRWRGNSLFVAPCLSQQAQQGEAAGPSGKCTKDGGEISTGPDLGLLEEAEGSGGAPAAAAAAVVPGSGGSGDGSSSEGDSFMVGQAAGRGEGGALHSHSC